MKPLAALIALAACGPKGAPATPVEADPPPQAGDDCTQIVDKMATALRGIGAGENKKEAIELCRARVNDPAMQCVRNASNDAAVIDCFAADRHPDDMPQAALVVTAVDPPSGDAYGGTSVHVRGIGFTCAGTCERKAKIYFGTRQGMVVRFASDGEILAEAPGGKIAETVDVVVIFEPGGEQRLPRAFTYAAK